ncbi:MAG: hypothetical protein EB833_05760 [Thaumarchaeota archaeon S13]|nr:MAG: hypothetical protein EB833_05760 [Thaumarchaeota archaeon S13]
MTVQELRADDKAAGRRGAKGAAPRQAPEEPAFDGEYRELLARLQREEDLQWEIFESRRKELLAAHPGKHIAVCNGEVFVADTAPGAAQAAMWAHGDHAAFYYSPMPGGQRAPTGDKGVRQGDAEAAADKAYVAELARSQKESARQREIFEANGEEILAAHPGKHIAVCNGEVFAADSEQKVAQVAMRAHIGHVSFFYSPGCIIIDLY